MYVIGTLVSGDIDIRFLRLFASVHWKGEKNTDSRNVLAQKNNWKPERWDME